MSTEIVSAFVLLVCVSGCSSPASGGPVELLERTGLVVDGGGAYELASTPLGVQLPTEAYESELAFLGSARGDGSLVRFRRSVRPSGTGGQLQQMSFERTDFGSTSGALEVPYLPTTFCAASGPCTSSYYADVPWPKALADGSVLMAVVLGSADPSVSFEPRHRLLRFELDGGLRLNAPLDLGRLVPQAVASALADGTLVVAASRGAGYSSAGVALELRAEATGEITSTVTLDTDQVPDSGAGISAKAIPNVTKVVPLRGGGFLGVGRVDMTRDIVCGSQDAPKPGGCGQGISHAMLVKFDQTGQQVWRRDLGRDYEQPGSFFVDATELEDGSLVATGHIEKRTDRWLEPDHGALLTRFSASGAIQRATRVCPCTQFAMGGGDALATNVRAVGTSDYEVVIRDGKGLTTAARFNVADELIGAGVIAGQSPSQQFITTDFGWASLASGKRQLIRHELAPR